MNEKQQQVICFDFDLTLTKIHSANFTSEEKSEAIRNPKWLLKNQVIFTFHLISQEETKMGIITQNYDGPFIQALLTAGFSQSDLPPPSIQCYSESLEPYLKEDQQPSLFILHRKDENTMRTQSSGDWKKNQLEMLRDVGFKVFYWDDDQDTIKFINRFLVSSNVYANVCSENPGYQFHLLEARALTTNTKYIEQMMPRSSPPLKLKTQKQEEGCLLGPFQKDALEKTCTFLSSKDLLNCQRVNEGWYVVANKALRERVSQVFSKFSLVQWDDTNQVWFHEKLSPIIQYNYIKPLKNVLQTLERQNKKYPEFFTPHVLGNKFVNLDTIRVLFKAGQLILSKDLLCLVARWGDALLMEELLNCLPLKPEEGKELFKAAVKGGSTETVQCLLYYLDFFDKEEVKKLMASALKENHPSIVKCLLEHKKETWAREHSITKDFLQSMLPKIVEENLLELLYFLTMEMHLKFDEEDLLFAIQEGAHLSLIQHLIEDVGVRAHYEHLLCAVKQEDWVLFNYMTREVFPETLLVPIDIKKPISTFVEKKLFRSLIKKAPLDELKYLIEIRRLTIEEDAVNLAILSSRWDIVAYLLKDRHMEVALGPENVPADELLEQAVSGDQLDLVQYLMDNGCSGYDYLFGLTNNMDLKAYLEEKKSHKTCWKENFSIPPRLWHLGVRPHNPTPPSTTIAPVKTFN